MNAASPPSPSATLPVTTGSRTSTTALTPQRQAQRQQKLECLAGSVLRALSQQKGWHFGQRHVRRADGSPLPWTAPHLHLDPHHGLEAWRAAADGIGMRQQLHRASLLHARQQMQALPARSPHAPTAAHAPDIPTRHRAFGKLHDSASHAPDNSQQPPRDAAHPSAPCPVSIAAVHAAHAPTEVLERMLYEWFEQLRVESLVPAHLPGVQANLQTHFERWTLDFHDSPLIDTHLGLLLFSVSQMLWARLQRRSAPEEVLDTMEATRANLAPVLGEDFQEMVRHPEDISRYAPASARLARTVARRISEAQREAQTFPANRRQDAQGFFLWMDDDPEADAALPVAESLGPGRNPDEVLQRYHVFTREFDREVDAASRVRAALLAEYRQQLDRSLHELHPPIARLARQLQALTARPVENSRRHQQEEGRIDGRRLARLLASPTESRIFFQDDVVAVSDCAITLLIDCSGSMKAHAQALAVFADILARITGMVQIPFEILGFTTASWHGGRATKAWRQAGSPPSPGRLAEREHLVFKTFEQHWRRRRLAVSSLLKADLYREGLDGEAVQWATQRLLARPERRRILWVISDGCPMEGATSQANEPDYLDSHLQAMVRRANAQGIETTGIGLGLDLSAFYPQRLAVEPEALLHTRTLQALIQTLSHRRR